MLSKQTELRELKNVSSYHRAGGGNKLVVKSLQDALIHFTREGNQFHLAESLLLLNLLIVLSLLLNQAVNVFVTGAPSLIIKPPSPILSV